MAENDEEFTLADLAAFDGREGRRSYIAFEGKVYDVTDSPLWTEGDHLGDHQAGRDLTEDMDAAPHGPEHLQNVKQVGVLVP